MDQHSFFFQAMVYLAAAVVCVPLAKKLGLGSVLGYLLAGILIGPAVLGFVGEEGQDIMHFAEFGVVMMLFVIGLELEPALLWKLRVAILGLGGLQVLLTAGALAGIAIAFGLSWKAAVAMGMILSLSSTAIVLQTLNEKKLMKSQAGQSAFSVLLFQDIAVIPMLAVLPLLATLVPSSTNNNHDKTLVSGQPAWVQTLIVLGCVAAIIIAGRYVIKYFLRLMAQTRLREVFTASTLLLVVGIAVLMTQVGLSPALGTFLAGVVLADSEYRHELESDIDPFKGLLLGLFFIAVGASIDFNLIARQPGLIFGLVALLMLVKAVVLFLLGKFFRLGTGQNLLFSLSLSQVGEFAFVLFSFSLQQGILPQAEAGIMIVVVAVSMAITPLLMLLNEKVLQPKFADKKTSVEREADIVDEKNAVIIAGFGRFGNIVGRFLKANKVDTTVLEIDSDRVDLLRKYGYKVYYGDATRYDLLHAAGAGEAKLLIVALGDPEKALELVVTCKKHFPHLRLLVRAYDRPDTFELMDAGMLHIYRETIDSSLRMGVDALKLLGRRRYQAQRSARLFLKHDERSLKQLAAVRDDSKEFISTSRDFIDELEQMIQKDLIEKVQLQYDLGWDEESLISEANRSAE